MIRSRNIYLATAVPLILGISSCGGGGGGGGGGNGGGSNGTITITSTSMPGDTLNISVTDSDLADDGTLSVSTVNNDTGESEAVTLNESAVNPGTFNGMLATAMGPAGTNNTGTMNTQVGHVLTATYNDELTASGGTATRTATSNVGDSGPVSGLDSRPASVACQAGPEPSSQPAAAGFGTENISAGASFSGITKIIQAPNDSSRWFVLEQGGRIVTFLTSNPGGSYQWLEFNVNSNGESGLLSMAFHPNYPSTPEVFVYYRGSTTANLARVRLDDINNPVSPTIDTILSVAQNNDFHNGGDLDFDSSGRLYWSLGDDLDSGQAQVTTNLIGSVLRLDIPSFPSTTYSIPSGNPFAGNALCNAGSTGSDCPEIWAWGLRNPWRISVDGSDLWVGDVGQGSREEVDRMSISGSASDNNYGWPCFEGNITGSGSSACQGVSVFQDPFLDYPRTDGSSITGGYVYRGSDIPGLSGRYVFADFVSGKVWATTQGGGKEELLALGIFIPSLARGNDGEIYIADRANNRILRLTGAGSGGSNDVPDDLEETGCWSADDYDVSGMIPYEINAPFWSDGAAKKRYMAIPPGATVDITGQNDFSFPPGTVLVKDFRLNGQLIETRLLMRHTNDNGPWAGYTYEWNNGTATRVRDTDGKTRNFNGQEWIYPGENQCNDCHTSAAGFALGPEVAQLNGDMTYSATGRTANQLETLDAIDVLRLPLPDTPDNLPALADPDGSASLNDRARAILHSNCANCHQPNTGVQSSMDLRYTSSFTAMNICNADSIQVSGAKLLVPGNAAQSLIVDRMNRRDAEQMPPLGSNLVDNAGVSVISDWINSLNGC